jgi:hypothetical protein
MNTKSDTFSYFSQRCAEIQKACCCHRINEKECFRARHPAPMSDGFDDDSFVDEYENCECSCHMEIGELELELWPEEF